MHHYYFKYNSQSILIDYSALTLYSTRSLNEFTKNYILRFLEEGKKTVVLLYHHLSS